MQFNLTDSLLSLSVLSFSLKTKIPKNSIMKTETKVNVGSRTMLNPTEIIFLESDINYTKIYLVGGESLIVSTTLGKLEPRFTSFNFFRINRSYMVNLSYAVMIQTKKMYFLRLPNNKEVSISRRKKEQFLKTLNTNQ